MYSFLRKNFEIFQNTNEKSHPKVIDFGQSLWKWIVKCRNYQIGCLFQQWLRWLWDYHDNFWWIRPEFFQHLFRFRPPRREFFRLLPQNQYIRHAQHRVQHVQIHRGQMLLSGHHSELRQKPKKKNPFIALFIVFVL